MGARACLALGLLLGLALAPACARRFDDRTLYQWTDADGNVHYTSHRQQIPVAQRLAAEPVLPAQEDGQGRYWSDGDDAAPDADGLEPAGGVSVEDLPPAAPLPPVESAPPEPEPQAVASSEPPEQAEGEVEAAALPPPDEAPVPVEERIRELERQVAADQETLKGLIADPESATRMRDSPELREISERLPRLQAELRSLREGAGAAQAAGDDGA